MMCAHMKLGDNILNACPSHARKTSRGFTLIELLVVIAVLGVLAAGVLTAINPLKRIQQANDTKIKNDISQIAQAEQAYFTSSASQSYALTVQALADSKDLKVKPVMPSGADYNITGSASDIAVWAPLTEIGTGTTTTAGWFCWSSFSGKAGVVSGSTAPSGTTCPGL